MKAALKAVLKFEIEPKLQFSFFLLVYTAVLLTAFEYFFIPFRVGAWLNPLLGDFLPGVQLRDGLVWVGSCFFGYLLIPFGFRYLLAANQPLAEFGWNGIKFWKHLQVYLWLYVAMLPLVYLSFMQPAFRFTYPLIPVAKSSLVTFLIWEIAYCLQFISLESFFRGWLLFSLRKCTGNVLAVVISAVPYTMIHFHKPAPEAFGALIAGIVLGRLALHFNSWYGGAVLHCLVAVTMDLLSFYAGR